MRTILKWTGAAIAAGTVAATTAFATGTTGSDGIETPEYQVERTLEAFEIREYRSRLVAEVEVEGSAKQASNNGFRILAGFIFGGNTSRQAVDMTAPVDLRASEKIAMTAPVDRRREGERWKVTFTMPSKYTAETLPVPSDDRIVVVEVPAKRYAAVRFSGAPSERALKSRIAEFRDAVTAEGIETTGGAVIYSRYDPPWTLPFMRRNELMLELPAASGRKVN